MTRERGEEEEEEGVLEEEGGEEEEVEGLVSSKMCVSLTWLIDAFYRW